MAGEILKIGAELGDPALTLEGLRIQLAAQFENGRHSAAVQTAEEMKTLAEAAGHPEFIRLAAMWDIVAAIMEGRFTEAEELAGELGRRLDQIGHSQAQLISVAQSASWRLLQGHATEYIAPFEAMSAADPGNLAWPAITAWCLAEAGARDRAAELLRPDRSGLGGGRGQELPVVGGGRRFLRRGRPGRRPAVGAGAVRSRRSLLREQLHARGSRASSARPTTGWACSRPRPAATPRPARTWRPRWPGTATMGARPWTALTEEAYGRVLSLRGQPADVERAAALTESAMRTAEELELAAITNRPRLRG